MYKKSLFVIFADRAIVAAGFLTEPARIVDAPAAHTGNCLQCARLGLPGWRCPHATVYIVFCKFSQRCLVADHPFTYTATHDNPLVFRY